MKKIRKITSLIMAIAMIATSFVFVSMKDTLNVHAVEQTVHNGTKYSLAMDVSSAVQGQFSFVYGTSHDQILGDAPSYPTANNGVLEVDGRQLFSVAADGFIHMDIPSTYSDPAFFAAVVFTAPVSGIYTFNMNVGLYKPGSGWNTDGGNWNNFRVFAKGYDVDADTSRGTGAGDNWPIIDHILYNAANGTGDSEEIINKTITMSAGDKIAFIPACGANGAYDLVRQFDVTLEKTIYELKMDVSSATQGQFSFVYGTSHDQILGDAPSYPTANNGVLEVDGRQLFSVAADGFIHMDIPSTYSDPAFFAAVVFTAPVSGVYTFNMNVGLYKPGSGWNTDGGNWNNFRVFAKGYDVDADTSRGTGAGDNWPIIDHILYNAANGSGDSEEIVNKTITMTAGDKIAFIPACGANGAYDLVRAFNVTLDEASCTSHELGNDDVCDNCGWRCDAHAWNGDNVCDTCGFTCNSHVLGNDAFCDVCGMTYTANIAVDPTAISRAENTVVKVSTDLTYAAGEVVVRYDATKFTFVDSRMNGGAESATYEKAENGTVTVATYGDEKSAEYFELVFAPIKNNLTIGETVDFELVGAAYSTAAAAEANDLFAANIGTSVATTTIVAEKYEVSISTPEESGLADVIEAVEGNTSYATEEQDYVINLPANNQYYTWNVEATVGTVTVANGVITVSGINENATVTVTRTVINRVVTQSLTDSMGEVITDSGVAFGSLSAVFGTDYLAVTVPANTEPDNAAGTSGYAYEVKVYYTSDTERENPITTASASVEGGLSYTVSGALITEDITVVVTRTETGVARFTATVNGPDTNKPGANIVNQGQPFSFTLTALAGFEYSVTYTVDGVDGVNTLTGVNGVYTIDEVNANVTVTVTRTVATAGVSVGNYLQLDGAMMYLITITGVELDEGCAYTYDGYAMYYNGMYDSGNGAYTFLVISEDTLPAPTATAKISIVTDGSVTNAVYNEAAYGYDVNGSDKVDVNDAQLVWNMYQGTYYSDFSRVTMLKFLVADTNGSGNVNVDDATAIVNQLYS